LELTYLQIAKANFRLSPQNLATCLIFVTSDQAVVLCKCVCRHVHKLWLWVGL